MKNSVKLLGTEKVLESFLPVFNGFYNTLFMCECEDSVIEDGKEWDDYTFDYEDYRDRTAKACVKEIESELSDFEVKIDFDNLYSPKYFNYTNDSINVTYTISNVGYEKLVAYIKENLEEFDEYIIDTFTSHSGFVSFHSNNYMEWVEILEKGEEGIEEGIFMGTILEFYFKNEEYTDYDLSQSITVGSENWVDTLD